MVRGAAIVLLLMCCSGPSPTPTPAPPPTPAAEARFEIRCEASFAPRPERDGSPMCWVPPGEFMMGAPFDEARPEDGKPRRVRITRGFYLDQFEVTVAQFARFLRSHGNRCGEADCFNNAYNPPIDISNERYEVRPGTETLPMTELAFRVAVAYCQWAGKQLPTEAEWELAARHDPTTNHDRLYPWGDKYRDGITNCGRDECNDGYPFEAPVGTFREDRSPIGAYDMGGNSEEWVNDCYRENVECGDPCMDPSITDDCDQICVDRRGKQVCWEGFLQRGGDTATPIDRLKAKARTSSPADGGAGIRCVRTGLAPRSE